jgi:hypothetical protein
LVPNDELLLQQSVDLYLTLNGVAYNTSHYLGSCAATNFPSCPIFVADTVSFGHPATYTLPQLSTLVQPTFVQTEGFLTGTTAKRVANECGPSSAPSASSMGGLTELLRYSPIDVGLYDMGYSDNIYGYNLASVYLVWGCGPMLNVTGDYSEGLYVHASSAAEPVAYLQNYSAGLNSIATMLSPEVQLLQSYVNSIANYVGGGPLNGSKPVSGIYLMMDSWAWSNQPAMMTVGSFQSDVHCSSALPFTSSSDSCLYAQVTISANSNQWFYPALSGMMVSLTGPTNIPTTSLANMNCVVDFSNEPACALPDPPATVGSSISCYVGMCDLSPYYVVNDTIWFCYDANLYSPGTACAAPPWTLYSDNNTDWPLGLLQPGDYSNIYFAFLYAWIPGESGFTVAAGSYSGSLT